jgi:hypothetical protein
MTSMHGTLANALEPHAVSLDLLRQRHGVLLAVADKMLGVVPNAGRYLEIWPVGFRTYNLLAPTFLNMPALMLSGGKQKKLVGLVMYATSRAAQCAYCSAHSCSFALRRGADAASGPTRSMRRLHTEGSRRPIGPHSTWPRHWAGFPPR